MTDRKPPASPTATRSWLSSLPRGLRLGLEWLLALVVIAYFGLGAVVLTTRYVILPRVTDYRPQIEAAATRAIGLPVTIGRIDAVWRGWHPYLTLENVRITRVTHAARAAGTTRAPRATPGTPPGAPPPAEPSLTLHRLDAVLSWTSLIHLDLRLSNLTLYEPDLTVERLTDGSVLVAGMPVAGSGGAADTTAADWLMRQARVVIRNGTVRWRDAMRDAPEVVVTHVNAMLRNRGFEHRFGMQANPPPGIEAPLDIRARFSHALFARPSDVKRWRGQLYGDVGTLDLSALARYVDLPGKDSRGRVAARAWVDFDGTAITGATLLAAGSNTSVQLADDLPPLTFDATQGRIDVTRTGPQAAPGWQLRARDLTLQAAGRPTLDVPDLRGTYAPANDARGLQAALSGQRLDIGAAMALVPSLPIDPKTRDTLARFRPRGRLANFNVDYQAPKPHGAGNWRDLPGIRQLTPERERYRVVADFDALGVDSEPSRNPPGSQGSQGPQAASNAGRPGFANLSGHVDADQSRGSLTLNARNATLDFPGHFDQPRIDLDTLSARASWRVSHSATQRDAPANVQVRVDALHLQNAELTGDVSGTWHNGGKGNGIVDLKGSIVRANASSVPRYLPTDIGASVRDYLQRALLGGTVQNAPFAVQGDLEDFPFASGGGKFRIDIPLVDVAFNPSPQRPGHTEVWPAFDKVRGNLRFDADKLHIAIDSGSVFGVALTQVQGDINDIGQDDSVLTLKGDARGPAADFVKYLNSSPVGHWIGDFTEETRASGTAQLAMQLTMPLDHTDQSKVTGRARFLRNDITLLNGLPTFGAVDGELAFNERGISLDNLRGTFLGGEVRASGGSRNDGTLALNINGTISAQGLRENRESAALAQLAKRMTGSTPYTATVTVRQGMTDVAVQSTLAGLAVNLPAPLGKTAESSLPARFTLRPQANPGGRRIDTLDFAIGSVQGSYVQQLDGTRVEVLRGGIGIDQPVPAPREGVQAAAQFDTLDVDAWRSVIASLASDAAKPGTQGAAATPAPTAAAASDEFGALTPYLPTRLALHAKQVRLMSRQWPELVLGAQRSDHDWQVSLASDLVSGFAEWHAPDAKNPSGTLRARLAKLVIPREEQGDDVLTQVLDEPSDEFPAIDVVANDFVLRDKPLGRLQLNAHNATEDGVPVWQLTKLTLSNSAATLDVKGNWRTSRRRAAIAGGDNNVPRRTVLDFNLDVKDAGGLLDRLGLPKTLKDGSGTVSGRFGWQGGPDAIDYPTLGGRVTIDLKRGQILKADPGLAKLLGILSVQTLAKILTFDFNSVIGSGLPFDSIVGNATMQGGVANTNDLTINANAATIKIDGHTDLAHETQDLNVLVLPKINAASASLAWAIVNPALGIGSFFAQLALGEQLSRTLSTTYHVTGSWDNPVIEQASSNKSKIDASPEARPGAQNRAPPEIALRN
ncbi:YhdP family protein [Pandoraea sp.]|uniref:YhdP family protein n=1 Tax=Pandoraea sp. TaxID=1883445 RepID=UPI0035B19106